MKPILSSLGMIASIVMLIASLLMNYLFLSSIGKTPFEGQVLGAVSASADLLKAVLPFYIAWAWQSRRWSIVVPGSFIWLLFAGFSLLSAIGFSAQNRSAVLEAHDDQLANKVYLQNELKRNQNKQADLSKHRPIELVNQEISGHKQHSRWQSTDECKEATIQSSYIYCQQYFQLRAELAVGEEAKKLDQEIKSLHLQLKQQTQNKTARSLSPQVTILSQIFDLKKDKLQLMLTIIIAVLVEVGASLGPYLSMGNHLAKLSPNKDQTQHKPLGLLEDFCLDCLISAPEKHLKNQELFRAYKNWCDREEFSALEEVSFNKAFQALAKDVGIDQQGESYQQIALV